MATCLWTYHACLQVQFIVMCCRAYIIIWIFGIARLSVQLLAGTAWPAKPHSESNFTLPIGQSPVSTSAGMYLNVQRCLLIISSTRTYTSWGSAWRHKAAGQATLGTFPTASPEASPQPLRLQALLAAMDGQVPASNLELSENMFAPQGHSIAAACNWRATTGVQPQVREQASGGRDATHNTLGV